LNSIHLGHVEIGDDKIELVARDLCHPVLAVDRLDYLIRLFSSRSKKGGQAGFGDSSGIPGVFPASTTEIPLNLNEPMPFSTVQSIENVERTSEMGRIASSPTNSLAGSSDESDLSTLQGELEQALHGEIASHQVSLHRETEGLVVSLREFGFFDSGSATIKPAALPALDRIASILAIRTCNLRIEGHTDNIPIHTPQMASNWELSTGRATELVRQLIVRYGFPPERLSAAGYAQYHPVASNITAQGRAQNRRVDIVILPSQAVAEGGLPANARAATPK
jgi:flagellar motor protein MotB